VAPRWALPTHTDERQSLLAAASWAHPVAGDGVPQYLNLEHASTSGGSSSSCATHRSVAGSGSQGE
jgi:hypothetical protein